MGNSTNPTHWKKVARMIQAAFHEGQLAEECAWQAVVLIHKGGGDFRGIDVVEVIWKIVTGIMNCIPTTTIQYHDTLRGFHT